VVSWVPERPLMEMMKLFSIAEAADELGTNSGRIWYAIRRKYWKPRYKIGGSYALDMSDIKRLREVFKKIERGAKRPAGSMRYLDDGTPPIEPGEDSED